MVILAMPVASPVDSSYRMSRKSPSVLHSHAGVADEWAGSVSAGDPSGTTGGSG